MRLVPCARVMLIVAVAIVCVDARKTFSTRRKSGNNRRGGSTSFKQKQAPPPVTPQKVDSFLAAERAGSSHGTIVSTNTHHRGGLFNNKPETPKQPVPQTNGPIGFDKVNQGNQKPIGFDKVNSEVQQKSPSAHIASAPPYPGKPAANAPNGPPPAYPGLGTPGTSNHGGFEAPPAYPGRPVNAPPVYSANNPSYNQNPAVGTYHQNNPAQGYQGQQNMGFPNTGGNQGYNQGFGSHPSGGYGQSYPGVGSSSYGGSPFGQSSPHGGSPYGGNTFGGSSPFGQSNGYGGSPFGGNSYGGSPFGQTNGYGGSPFGGNNYGGSPFGHTNGYGGSPFGGNTFGGSGYGNPHYSPNNFGYSSHPGGFGSSPYPGFTGQYGNSYGYHKKSRFGGLPIPIPIPIPIPLGGFGFGGHSRNHRTLDTFIKNQTVDSSDNSSTSVFIINNATVTPCTTDQFIYDSLNVTVMSCTAENCTAIKVFTTANVSNEITVYSAGITMCLENNTTTYSSFADNVNPVVSDLHKYWMSVCKEVVLTNNTGSVNEQAVANVTVRISETPVANETVAMESKNITGNPATDPTDSTTASTSTVTSDLSDATTALPPLNNTLSNVTVTNSSSCEIFNCSWIEMCLPSIELVDRCSTPDCPFTRTGYRPCVRVKMCNSPSTLVSTFATLNNTISRIDQFNNITSVNDVANLTLISYVPPSLPVNCSQNAADPACQQPVPVEQKVCVPGNSTEAINFTLCVPAVGSAGGESSAGGDMSATGTPVTTMPHLTTITDDFNKNVSIENAEMRQTMEGEKVAQS